MDPTDTSNKASLQVSVDHTAPFVIDSDRNGDGSVDPSDACFDSSEQIMGRQTGPQRDFGPGQITPDKNTATDILTYEATLSELGVPEETRQLYIWADVLQGSGGGNAQTKRLREESSEACDDFGWKAVAGLTVQP